MPTSEPLDIRATPVQQRGLERVDKLLDSAARIIDAQGIAGLTTSAVAEDSGSSVGVVYRYFPNVDALLTALAERNRNRFMSELANRIEQGAAPSWYDFVRLCIVTFADFAREEPAFSTLRFGDVIALRYAHRQADTNDELAKYLDAFLHARYGFELTEDLHFATELAMECADAITRRSFFTSTDGEPRFTEAAVRIITAILYPHSPGGQPIAVPGLR